jgi:uncharacterized protein YciI
MFDILGLIAKAPFADGEQPVSNPDEIIEARKAKEAQRAIDLEEAKKAGFEPRKVTSVN